MPPTDPAHRAPGIIAAYAPFLGISCVLLAALVLLLARQNNSLKAQLTTAAQRTTKSNNDDAPQVSGTLTIGEHLDAASIFTFPPASDDQPRSPFLPADDTLRFAGAPATLLFLFDGGCEACDAMHPIAARLARAAQDLAIPFIAVQIDAASAPDLKPVGPGVFVCGMPDKRTTWLQRIDAVPGLALIDQHGTVRKTWLGVIDPAQELQVQHAMQSLNTPGQPAAHPATAAAPSDTTK